MGADKTLLEVAACLGKAMKPSARILDFGCGSGGRVKALREAGYDAYGVDIKFKAGPHVDELQREGHIRHIETEPYCLPFADAHFDFVFSEQVFEHVQNQDESVAELARVMKPGALGVHRFPSRLRPLESHIMVPLASVFRPGWWILLWTWAGFRKASQKGLPVHEVAMKNRDYLERSTNYPSGRAIWQVFRRHFSRFGYADKCWFANSPNRRGRVMGRIAAVLPFVGWIFRTFWTRVIFHIK